MNQAGEAHAWNVAAGIIDTVKVPNSLGCLGVVVFEETTAILAVKDTGESPRRVVEWLHVSNIYNKKVAWLGTLDVEGTGEIMHLCEVDLSNIVGAVIVPNLATGPVDALNFDSLARLNATDSGNCKKKATKLWSAAITEIDSGDVPCFLALQLTVWMPAIVKIRLLRSRHIKRHGLGGANLARHGDAYLLRRQRSISCSIQVIIWNGKLVFTKLRMDR